jgi:hypothetical protein
MAKALKDLAVKTGEYQKNGVTKGRWMNVGKLMASDDGGEFIILNRAFNPAGIPNPEDRDTLLISCFDVKDWGDGADKAQQGPQQPAKNELDDEIPF